MKRVVLLIAMMSSFLTPFMSSSVNIALPSIGQELSIDAVLLGWVASAYLLAAAMFLVPFGRVADIYGRKKVFTYGVSLFTLSSLLIAISDSTLALIAFRVAQGIGGAMIFGTGVAILTSVFPAGERGRALGINVAAVYTGLSLGPFVGGFLTQTFGWRSIFLANVPIGLIVIVIVAWKLEGEWAGAKGEKFDVGLSGWVGVNISAVNRWNWTERHGCEFIYYFTFRPIPYLGRSNTLIRKRVHLLIRPSETPHSVLSSKTLLHFC